ncbi:MAG: hypothetical protein ABIR24_00435 [Verrucomicrobiota bacterium]
MNQIVKSLLLFAVVGLSINVHALTPDNRYDTIIDRNIFRLNPIPPTLPPTNTNPELTREVKLSGISNIGGNKKAWLIVPAKPGSKDLPLYLNLSEGEGADFLEVVSISEEDGTVKILHSKNPMTLSLKNDSLKPAPVAPLAPPAPGVAPVANVITPQPTAPSYGTSYPNTTPQPNARAVTVTGGTPSLPAIPGLPEGSSLRSIPTRTLRVAPGVQPVPETPVDPKKQREVMEIQKAVYDAAGQPLPPLPPTP